MCAAQRGSAEAASILFERHWPAAWRTALGITGSTADADDVAQESFERAFGRITDFRRRSSFRTWLLRIVINRSLNLVRDRARLTPLDIEQGEHFDDPSSEPDVIAAVAHLHPERRVVVALRYWLDCSPTEIAATLGVPVGTVHSRLSRALADVRRELEVNQRD